jgi:hypothetical protein
MNPAYRAAKTPLADPAARMRPSREQFGMPWPSQVKFHNKQPSVFVAANLSTEVFMTVAGATLSWPASMSQKFIQ